MHVHLFAHRHHHSSKRVCWRRRAPMCLTQCIEPTDTDMRLPLLSCTNAPRLRTPFVGPRPREMHSRRPSSFSPPRPVVEVDRPRVAPTGRRLTAGTGVRAPLEVTYVASPSPRHPLEPCASGVSACQRTHGAPSHSRSGVMAALEPSSGDLRSGHLAQM